MFFPRIFSVITHVLIKLALQYYTLIVIYIIQNNEVNKLDDIFIIS